MPPRKNIVKSGNAGTSSKGQKPKQDDSGSSSAPSGPPPLFPPGSKTPLSLLYERCQKNGWDKPEVQTFRRGEQFSAVVIVQKKNPRTSAKETIRLEPHPPKEMPSLLEAKHWAATYALYRVSNTSGVLPAGPRGYWQELAEEHRKAPEHLKWQYDPDPFAAKAAVEERQRKAAAKREKADDPDELDLGSFDRGVEVRMGAKLRDAVESAVKKVIQEFPEVQGSEDVSFLEDDALIGSLSALGFKAGSIRTTLEALSSNSAFTSALLVASPPLEAALEYLLLHTPESELPKQFQPSKKSSNPFVSSAHAGGESLQRRWMEDRAVKEAGYPRLIVNECIEECPDNLDLVFELLTHRLLGLSNPSFVDEYDRELCKAARNEELEAIQSVYPDVTFNEALSILTIPIEGTPATLNIIYSAHHPYPLGSRIPPFYVTSDTLPAYLRLYFVMRIAETLFPNGQRVEDEGICFNGVEAALVAWSEIEGDTPPKLEDVLRNLAPPRKERATRDPVQTLKGKPRRVARTGARDTRSDEVVLKEFTELKRRPAYQEMETQRKRLPAWEFKNELVETIRKNQVTIVVGETVPQFILDEEIESKRGSSASIIITQPRRVSVLGVSSRVSTERTDDGSVGYAIRGESRVRPSTKLLFCTTGVLLRRLAGGDDLENVTHVVVDEVHERSVDSDFLLLELREMIKANKSLKVVLMSATINQKTFSAYFDNAPVIEIPGRTYPVTDVYLEEILPLVNYQPQPVRGGERFTAEQSQSFRSFFETAGIDQETIKSLEMLKKADRIDYQLVTAIVKHILRQNEKGAILISCLTSITIDDVIYVIDGGKVKENDYDPETGLARLEETLVTRASANQRRGRAGRVQAGTCYKLFTKRDWDNMRKFPVPEMQRVPLDSLLLQIKVTRSEEDPKQYLSRSIDPPKLQAMDSAWAALEELGAVDPDGNILSLGRYMSMLPVDLRLGKMMILGTLFGCLSTALTIVACLSSKPLFVSPMDKREEANKARAKFSTENSDILTNVNAFNECLVERGRKKGGISSFCEENFISYSTFRDIVSLRAEFASALSDIGFIPFGIDPSDPRLNVNESNTNLVKAIIVGGLWPRISKAVLPKAVFERVAAGSTQKEHQAKEVKYFTQEGRAFIHPSSTLFSQTTYKSRFLTYFTKVETSKIFLRDVTEVPLYGLLLFGGVVRIKHIGGGINVGSDWLHLKASPRIGVLINQLRRLLDAQMGKAIDDAALSAVSSDNPIVDVMLSLLNRDGLDPDAL
ncbi:related to helicases [Serendipita indica DSM 11827]|uniref:Related to helicases n=1 Tax=Serendipita indica (strain DSM 11827) TaxID=1109443 RepID=G4TQP2_SERID|nr:related to helicases [Serendipita indica DSM 11827]